MSAEAVQSAHYDSIVTQYDLHYDDPVSQAYRQRFIHHLMFAGIDMRGKRVLDGMSGSGQIARFLSSSGAIVTGLDISAKAIVRFKQRTNSCDAVHASMLHSTFRPETFDCVAVEGGLHHLHPYVQEGICEIHRVLRTGGVFSFMEPPRSPVLDFIRRIWYRLDPLIAQNEAPIDIEEMKRANASRFEFTSEEYGGNLAYLFVFNSMLFRIPIRWKSAYAPAMMRLEEALAPVLGRSLSFFVICQWKKR